MVRAATFTLALTLLACAPSAKAQSATPDSENGRYMFKQMGDELLRLDGRTGQVSTCSKRAVGWACLAVPDERTALEAEILRTQAENAALKKELISRGIALPSGVKPPDRTASKPDDLVIQLPTDADLERVMSFFEKAWRRLIDLVQKERDKS